MSWVIMLTAYRAAFSAHHRCDGTPAPHSGHTPSPATSYPHSPHRPGPCLRSRHQHHAVGPAANTTNAHSGAVTRVALPPGSDEPSISNPHSHRGPAIHLPATDPTSPARLACTRLFHVTHTRPQN